MSLNGLDDAAIKEAHEATVSEPGGWFLIKYASRDGVELHDRGTGGIVEFQNAIAQYEEASPLYGFLRYRRRNVIVKCLPDACSRLVQARVTVHFNAVCERFAPYNTTFSIADAKDLKDSKLSAACSLHTASSSTSSSTSSLRRRRLMEIAEEEEEELRATKRQLTAKDGDYPGTQNEPGSVTFAVSHSTLLPAALNSELAKSPNESHFAGTVEPPSFTGIDRPSSPAKSLESRSISPQLSHLEMSNYAAYAAGKPKVKLAPRPSVDVSGRPRTSAGTGTQRPVSAIPAGFRLQSKGSRKGRSDANVKSLENSVHQISEDDAANIDASSPTETDSIEALANISGTLDVVRPHTSSGRPTSSSGISVKSVATTATATAAKHTTMTPEKARLIKAMKLREKKKKMSTLPPLPIPSLDICEPVDEIVSPNTSQPEESHGSISATGTSFSGGFDDRPGSNSGRSANNDMPNSSFSDSAIDMGLSAIDQSSIITQTSDLHSPCARPASSGGSESAKTVSLPGTADKQVLPLQDTDLEKNLSEHNLPEDDLINNNDSDVAGSDANLSDDERLTDELQSVTVHEAKSMTVSKSPITPVFPKASPPKQEAAADGELNRSIRTVSGPTQSSLLNPGDAAASSARSASSGNAFLQKIAQQNSANLLPKKTNIGSTISQRIKALEKLSGNTPGATAEMPLRDGLNPFSGSGDEGKSSTAEFGHKKTGSGSKNRTSRFMRRLSSSLSAGRKAATPAISPTVTEEEEAFSTVLSSRGGPVAQRNTLSYLGDVNVQFPDNLLWKRRAMCLDSQGFLVLKMEVQELPNSVCLDFVDGPGLQVACEDRAGQLNVLRVLREAYQKHTTFGQ
ncbi:hypothetical protein SEPCBS119000_005273 [Sporothrix epigloea]|uniref:Uncharacterized protein n=1 Tax=Sporothrix epigloea TaxID=1892477 RepID=A0ABP0E0J3_9PEZI